MKSMKQKNRLSLETNFDNFCFFVLQRWDFVVKFRRIASHLPHLDQMRISLHLIFDRLPQRLTNRLIYFNFTLLTKLFRHLLLLFQSFYLQQQVDRHTDGSNSNTNRPMFNSQSLRIHMKSSTTKSNQQSLQSKNTKHNNNKKFVT